METCQEEITRSYFNRCAARPWLFGHATVLARPRLWTRTYYGYYYNGGLWGAVRGPKELVERPAAKCCEDHLKHLAGIAATSNITRPSSATRLSATRGGDGEAVITARLLPAPQASYVG
jgi:hypothetical protein